MGLLDIRARFPFSLRELSAMHPPVRIPEDPVLLAKL
jgi:hypothetical protein